ncbi:hypothetical protein [Croceicoccus sp. Ery15]|uniref:hypothetical protein n=1 Tax=Croceicoccus sp. Ery15 TaxID=1703338 RepID=UPI001E5542CD|nr:hypothetical protein [Croceicoccus sp. Ery15]
MTFLTGNLWRAGAIALAAFAVLFFVQLRFANGTIDDLRDDLKSEQQAHAITAQSVETLRGELAAIMERARLKEAELQSARKKAERQRQVFAQMREESDRRIERLLQAANDLESGCATPEALIRDAEGL